MQLETLPKCYIFCQRTNEQIDEFHAGKRLIVAMRLRSFAAPTIPNKFDKFGYSTFVGPVTLGWGFIGCLVKNSMNRFTKAFSPLIWITEASCNSMSRLSFVRNESSLAALHSAGM